MNIPLVVDPGRWRVPELSDATVAALGALVDWPDFTGTRYDAIDRIGGGGMGSVYSAVDRTLGRRVAIKVASTGLRSGTAGDRLTREARVLAALEHPGLVPVHDAGRLPDGRPYYVMKLVRGERLDAYCAHGPTSDERLRIFARICEAMAFAHANGVIHRDLKPENIMIGPFGEVLVLDWGLARVDSGVAADDGSFTEPGATMGTAGYMAPEQLGVSLGSATEPRADERSDVYALGGVLAALQLETTRGSSTRAIAAIVHTAQSLDPTDRYQSVAELARDVARFGSGDSVTVYDESPVERIRRLVSRHRDAIGLVLAYVLIRVLLLLARA